MPFPGFNNLSSFTPTQQQQLEQFVTYLHGFLRIQHTDGGRHGAITVDSVSDADGTFGAWTRVAHSAGHFTASAGTWTVDAADQVEYQYSLVGKTMTLRYDIRNTDVSNAGVTLKIAIPGGFVGAARAQTMVGYVSDNGGALVAATALIASGASVVELFATLNAGTFALTAADNTLVFGTLIFEVQ
jgi:hypothetical protein